jgi:hypothetical protein
VAMTQDLFLARPEDPLSYMQQRLSDWNGKGFRDGERQPHPPPSAEMIEAGNAYLSQHNIRHLFIELGLRAMRTRPSDTAQGVRGYLGEVIERDREGILAAVTYMLDPHKQEREARAARKEEERLARRAGARAAARETREDQAREFAFACRMFEARRASAYKNQRCRTPRGAAPCTHHPGPWQRVRRGRPRGAAEAATGGGGRGGRGAPARRAVGQQAPPTPAHPRGGPDPLAVGGSTSSMSPSPS